MRIFPLHTKYIQFPRKSLTSWPRLDRTAEFSLVQFLSCSITPRNRPLHPDRQKKSIDHPSPFRSSSLDRLHRFRLLFLPAHFNEAPEWPPGNSLFFTRGVGSFRPPRIRIFPPVFGWLRERQMRCIPIAISEKIKLFMESSGSRDIGIAVCSIKQYPIWKTFNHRIFIKPAAIRVINHGRGGEFCYLREAQDGIRDFIWLVGQEVDCFSSK